MGQASICPKMEQLSKGHYSGRFKYGVNSSRATEGRRSEPSERAHSVALLDAPVSGAGQAPHVRHNEKEH